MVPHSEKLDCDNITVCAYIYPTTPITDVEVEVGEQGIITKWDGKKQTGFEPVYKQIWLLDSKVGRGKVKRRFFAVKASFQESLVSSLCKFLIPKPVRFQ